MYPVDDSVKSSYHRFILNPDKSFKPDVEVEKYDTLDYCLVKKGMNKTVKTKRIPEGFDKMEVPYKVIHERYGVTVPNFDAFPSDHTLNIYEILPNEAAGASGRKKRGSKKNPKKKNRKKPKKKTKKKK